MHNVFPTMSPAVYQLAFDLGVPIVHFLHSYRLSCVNGFFLNHGEPCQRCIGGNFLPAFATKCWRDSRLASGMMGLVLREVRALDVFEKVSRWIAISHAQKAEHVKMGLPADRIDVIHHFYEPAEASPPLPATNGRTALFLGRLSPEKGVAQLLEAWRLLDRSDCKLMIAGDGPQRPALEAQAARLGLRNVEFMGFVRKEHQRALWEQAAFSLAPSVWLEPFGMVVLEAWANARPIIATAHGSFPELIEHGRTGLLARPRDPAALAEQMARMFDAPREAAAMGQQGRDILAKRFTRALWREKIAKVYGQLGLDPARMISRKEAAP
jgi:glycosyltransferase involved in cell wall biosynthesis